MSHRFIATRDYPGRCGILKPGSYAIPAEISMGDAKAARADGYGHIERTAAQQPSEAAQQPSEAAQPTPGGGQAAAQPFPPGYEHKEQPAVRRGRPRKT